MRFAPICMALLMSAAMAHAQPKDAEYEKALAGLVEVQNQMPQMMKPLQDQLMMQMVQQVATEKGGALTAQQKAVLRHMNVLVSERVLDPALNAMTKQMMPMVAEIYRRNFSREEVVDMYRFYASPSGKSIMAKMPAVMEASAKQMVPMIVQSQALMKAEMDKQMPAIVAEAKRRAAAETGKTR